MHGTLNMALIHFKPSKPILIWRKSAVPTPIELQTSATVTLSRPVWMHMSSQSYRWSCLMLLRMGNKTAPPSACDFNFHHGFGNTMPECVSRKLLLLILTETKTADTKQKLTMLPSDDEEESALATYTLFAVSPACAPRHVLLPVRIWEIIKCQGDRGRPGSWRLPVKRVPWRCTLWQRFF